MASRKQTTRGKATTKAARGKKKAAVPARRKTARRATLAADTPPARRKAPATGVIRGAGLTARRAPAVGLGVRSSEPRAGLTMDDATRIVRAAANFPSGSLETTLERAGLITENLRDVFRHAVRERVREAGGTIDVEQVSSGPTVLLREVRDEIVRAAS